MPTAETSESRDNTEALWALRARLRPVAYDRRVRACALYARGDAEVVIQDCRAGRRAYWGKIQHCQRQYACPVCGARKAAQRADQLDRLMSGDVGGRWQMVTLTLLHSNGETLRAVLDRLVRGWRKVRSHRAVREIMGARVTASVRAIETTWGAHGWHPHIHLLLRTSAWTEEERRTLETHWCKTVGAVRGVGVVWNSPIAAGTWQSYRAQYVSKLGCEVAGIGKAPKPGHLSPWAIAERAAECRATVHDTRWLFLWQEYQRVMKGRRILEFDERARAMVPAAAPEPVTTRRVEVYGEVYEAAMRHSWWRTMVVLESAIGWETLDEAAAAVESDVEELIDELRRNGVRLARAPPARADGAVAHVA